MAQSVFARPHYIDFLKRVRSNGFIKVIQGPRRCGKSFLLRLFRDYLVQSEGVGEDQIVHFELDRRTQRRFLDAGELHDEILRRRHSDKVTYVFIDEVQECLGFESVLGGLASDPKLDLYVTGSNAYMLSGELATHLTGRYIAVPMYPLSFSEYRAAVEDEGMSAEEDFNRYITTGGFPSIVPCRGDQEMVDAIYSALVNDIVIKDIGDRLKIAYRKPLVRLVETLASSLGSAVSPRRIANTLKTEGVDLYYGTVDRYLDALADAYFFYRAQRFDIRGNEALRSQEKFYLCDPGLRGYLIESHVPDIGHLLENVVFLELKRRASRVRIGKNAGREIDFVAKTGVQYAYIQVAYSVADENTLRRELEAFEKIPNSYPRFLFTMDVLGKNQTHNGVLQINIIDWLLGKAPLTGF